MHASIVNYLDQVLVTLDKSYTSQLLLLGAATGGDTNNSSICRMAFHDGMEVE